MIEIFMHNSKWRVRIVNETLEYDNEKEFKKGLDLLIEAKTKNSPYK